MVRSDVFEDTGKRAGLDRMVTRDGLVMLAVALGRHADVRTLLPIHDVAERAQGRDQLRAGHVARQLHRARTSSRTKWSRITFGASIVSSK